LNRSGYNVDMDSGTTSYTVALAWPRQADQLCLRSRPGKVNEFINDPLQEIVHDGNRVSLEPKNHGVSEL